MTAPPFTFPPPSPPSVVPLTTPRAFAQCPDACSIVTPDKTEEYGKGARPNEFSYVIHTWKHPKGTKIKPQRVRVERNPCCAMFCPLYTFLHFSAISGQGEIVGMEKLKPVGQRKFVPMFPDFDPDTNMFNFFKKAGTLKIWSWVEALLKLAKLDDATPHSIRASACIWALRCYVSEF